MYQGFNPVPRLVGAIACNKLGALFGKAGIMELLERVQRGATE